MVVTMLIMTLAVWSYSIAVVLWRARALVLLREAHADWAQREALRRLGGSEKG